MKKITLGLLALSILITGCSSENKAKNKSVNSNSSAKVNSNTNEDKSDNLDNAENKNVSEFNHDMAEIKKMANNHMGLSYNTIDIKLPYRNGDLTIPPGIYSIQYYSKDLKKLPNDSFAVPLYDFVDYYNIYNRKTYNEEDVLKSFKEIISRNKDFSYEELDESFSEKTSSEINDITASVNFMKYYKKDKMVVFQVFGGVGGASVETISPESDWKIDGDTVTVPFINNMDKTVGTIVVLKVNRKNYTGGKNRSKYYYYDLIYNKKN